MATIIVESNNQRVPAVNVVALFPDETWELLQTDQNGKVTLKLDDEALSMKVFAAAEGYEGVVKEGWVPADGELKLEMKEFPGGGSCIFNNEWGHIPGLSGTLFAQTNGDKIQINTQNIAVDGKNPPSTLVDFGQVLNLTHHDGVTMSVSIREIVGKSVLLDWWPEHSNEPPTANQLTR